MENKDNRRPELETVLQISIIAVGFITALLIIAAAYSSSPVEIINVYGQTTQVVQPNVQTVSGSNSQAATQQATTTASSQGSVMQQVLAEGSININTATADELDGLPGIGPVMSARIIEYREENGLFKTVDELKSVSGIGEKSFEKLKEYITVE